MRAQEFLAEDEPFRIKLGGAEAAAKAKTWIEKVYAKYPQTMQNNHVMTWGSGDDLQFAMFELVPSFSKRGAVEVKWIQAYPLRQGVGSRAMKELQALAREDGISLTLFPWDKGQVSQAKLTKFYRGQGFAPTVKGGKAMAWTPDLAEGVEQRYLTQISNLAWKPLTRGVWNTIQDEGLDEEQDAPKHTDWVMASLDVSAEDAQALQSFDDNAIEDFNRFDIQLKSRYPGLTDLIDYDNGTVTIVKPLKQDLAESIRVDVPNEEWLEDAIAYAKRKSPTHYGLPYMGKTTATVRQVEVPVNLLRRIPGMRREQQNVRYNDLAAIEKIMKDTGKLPIHSHSNEEYKPFINVAYDGSAWVNEGNHRIMAAYRLGWDSLPVEISYFDGGERVESGPMYPGKIGL